VHEPIPKSPWHLAPLTYPPIICGILHCLQWLPLRSAAFQHGPLSDTSEPAPTRTTKHPYYDTTPNSSRESPNPRPRCGERLPTWRHQHGRICRCPYTRASPAGAAQLTTTGALTGTSRPLRSDRTTSGVATKQGAGGSPGWGAVTGRLT